MQKESCASAHSPAHSRPIFNRKQLVLHRPLSSDNREAATNPEVIKELGTKTVEPIEERCFLITNASQNMAKEITMQLALAMPGCSLIYAPTIEIAKLILKRRQINLVISSPMLPDGPVESLHSELETLSSPPDLIVVGEKSALDTRKLKRSIYNVSRIKKFGQSSGDQSAANGIERSAPLQDRFKSLGDDLRNDLNNPLQEIVAMVFIAKSSGAKNSSTDLALDAIDRAAQSLAQVVGSLEDKIREKIG